MGKRIGNGERRWLWLAIAGALVGCMPTQIESVTTTRPSLTTSNGLGQNGLTTNGLVNNGFWNNGFWNNGFWNNGFWNNGFWNNGFWNNGFWNNGFWNNGFWNNGFWNNGFWNNGLTAEDATRRDILRNNAYSRQLLQYIYSCAMPATTLDAMLDPNEEAPLMCASDTDCDTGYACSAEGTCIIPLKGGGANGSGLGINADGTTWWESGKCDETCQRWVSACVLARTNAYGVHVQISMRAPADAPQAIKDALRVDDTVDGERDTFTLREGAYYGNIFATTPSSTTLGPCTKLADGTDSCEAVGPIASTPQYYACAGPGSNVPEITKRFCSSQGDQVVIQVPGVCLATTTQPGTCTSQDTDPSSETRGAIGHCYTNTSQSGTAYDQVITVFLKKLISVCGNAVCESGEDPTSCASDCHPGTWARDLPDLAMSLVNQGPQNFNYLSTGIHALAPDDSIVVAGTAYGDVDLGGGTLPVSQGYGVLAKYNPDGSYAWSVRYGAPQYIYNSNHTVVLGSDGGVSEVNGVTVAANGDITVVASTWGYGCAGSLQCIGIWIETFDENGLPIATDVLPVGIAGSLWSLQPMRVLTYDSKGNLIVAGSFTGVATFGSYTLSAFPGSYSQNKETFLAKISPQGSVLWARGFTNIAAVSGPDDGYPLSVAVAPNDDVLLVTSDGVIHKLASADASLLWSKSGYDTAQNAAFQTVAVDGTGNVYAGGYIAYGADFGPGLYNTVATTGPVTNVRVVPPFVAKYDSDGKFQWVSYANAVCAFGQQFCGGTFMYSAFVSFTKTGDIVLASVGDPVRGGGVDFGVGLFPTYASDNVFLSAYSPDVGQLRWAKQIPMILSSSLLGVTVDSQNRVVLSGSYSGSMQVDDHVLMTGIPEQPGIIDSFVASFATPPSIDTKPPDIGVGKDEHGLALDTMPRNIYTEATSPQGTVVFYMPPTAIDDGNAGTTVTCLPPPNTTFPITTTTVNCTASDPLGNKSTASFTVTVVDSYGPVFPSIPDYTVQATSAAGAVAPYPIPPATDQISGSRQVSCLPASGGIFPIGTTPVTCTSTDAASNQSQAKFNVIVTPPPFGAACTSSTDCAAGTCVDGVCCNLPDPTLGSCGQCRACNVAGSLGTCAPTSGIACSDGNACTQNDTCQAGTCVAGAAITCTASDQCHVAGTCNPATGACSNPAAPDGMACDDGNACTTGDVCATGTCAAGGAVSCDDQNPCTVDSCSPIGGCAHMPGNAGAICRAAANACDSAEICTGTSAACPASSDAVGPSLGAGTNQTLVGNCSGSPVTFAIPALANSSCESGTNVTCTWSLAGSRGTCAKSGRGASVPGNKYGAYAISCTAKDVAGNTSPVVTFTVTVLQPLTVKVQSPLAGDNDTIDNVVKLGSTVPTKVRLYACGSDVTRSASVTVKLATTHVASGGSSSTQTIASYSDTPDTSGVMTLDGSNYRYNLATKGLSTTAGIPAFYQENISVAYKSSPGVVVGSDAIQLDIK